MSNAVVIRDLLKADATIVAALTGGIYEYEADTQSNGLSEGMTPTSPYLEGVLRPCCLIKGRAELPTGDLDDPDGNWLSVRQVVELWFYDAGAFTTIRTARDRAYVVLNRASAVASGGNRAIADIEHAGDLDLERDPNDLANAARLRQDWSVTGVRST